MASCLLILFMVTIKFCDCIYGDNKYYPVFGAKSFQLNLKEDITYGTASPSVTALDENIFAIVYAASPKTRNINYNENIYCRLFYINENTQEIQLLYQTIKINILSDKQNYAPQILALSDYNNQITEYNRFAIVWYCNDINGNNFDGIYSKTIRWDYEEENENKLPSIIILAESEMREEKKINDEIHEIIDNNIQITAIFDIRRFVVTWLSWNNPIGNIFEYDIYAKVLDDYNAESTDEFIINIPSSKLILSQSITPISLSNDPNDRSTYFITVWSVYDSLSGVTGIYGKLLDVGGIAQGDNSIVKYMINETVMDGGIDIYNYKQSNGKYYPSYTNKEPDITYLMKDYIIVVWNKNKKQIYTAIYYIDLIHKQFVNVFINPIHETQNDIIYNNPKVNTITCYQSNINYNDFKNIDHDIIINKCDISICYDKNFKYFCSFWTIYYNNNTHNISMNKYYENDIKITTMELQNNNTYISADICDWNRIEEDYSNPINGKLLIIEQINNENNGFDIYGTVIKYNNRSLETTQINNINNNNMTVLLIVFVIVFIIFIMGVFYAVYYKQCKSKHKTGMEIKNEIINKLSKLNPINKHRHHVEVSGVDTDDEHDNENKNNKTKTVIQPIQQIINNKNNKNKNHQFQVNDDSDSDSDDTAEIGGGINTRHLTDSSISSDNNINNDSL